MSSTSSTLTVCYFPDLETLFVYVCVCVLVSAHMVHRWKESRKHVGGSFKQSSAIPVVAFWITFGRGIPQNHICFWLSVTAESLMILPTKAN